MTETQRTEGGERVYGDCGKCPYLVGCAMRFLLLAFVVAFPASVRADWVFVVEGKERYSYPDEAVTACSLDRASWKLVHPDDKTECRKIKGKGK